MGVQIREKPKGSGAWWIFINHQGKRKSKKIGAEDLARTVAKKIDARLTLGDLGLDSFNRKSHTFGEYAEKWLAFVQLKRRESTFERYQGILKKHVLPVFKDMNLEEITKGDIRNFLVTKSKNLNISLFRDVLSGVFGYAVDDEILDSNPVIGITRKLEITRTRIKDVEPFTEAELNTFLEACPPDPFFFTAARTGMRLGELLSLRWGDIDFSHKITLEDGSEEDRPFIWVRRTYRRGRFTAPKNGKSRKVDMSGQLREALKNHLTREKKRTLKEGLGEVPELLFHRNGEVMEQNYIRRVFKRILQKAGLRDIKLHGLRHTFASLLLSKGESPVYVKEQLGHSSIQITVDIYGKWIQTKKEAGVNKLDAPKRTLSASCPEKSHLTY